MLRQFKKINSKGHEDTWEWEETPEVLKAIEQLHKTSADVESKKTK